MNKWLVGVPVIALILVAMYSVAFTESPTTPTSCKQSTDCVVQDSCTCCDYAVNKYFVQERDCAAEANVRCAAECPEDVTPACVEGYCQLVKNEN